MLPSFNGLRLSTLYFCILSLFVSCASTDSKTVDNKLIFVLDDLSVELPPASIISVPRSLHINQHAIYKNEEYDFQNFIEMSKGKIEISSLSSFGVEIFSISYQDSLSYTSILVPKNFNPSYILFDLMLVYLPAEELAIYLSKSGLDFEEKSDRARKSRILSYQGDTICAIVYQNAEVLFENRVRNYSYTFTEIED